MTSEVGEILRDLGWSVECRGKIFVKGKGYMTTYFVDPKSAPSGPAPLPVSVNNNNNNQRRKSSHDRGTRRRSSQLSMNTIKAMLKSRHGSLDINTDTDQDNISTQSLPLSVYRSIQEDEVFKSNKNKEKVQSAGATPRSSVDDILPQLAQTTDKVPVNRKITTTTSFSSPAVATPSDKPIAVSHESHTNSSNPTDSSLSHLSVDSSTRAIGSSDISSLSARSSTASRPTSTSSNQEELNKLLDNSIDTNLDKLDVVFKSQPDSSQAPPSTVESSEEHSEKCNNKCDDSHTSINIDGENTTL